MAKQKLTRQRLRQIIKEEKQKLEESNGDPMAVSAVRDLGLKEIGFENIRDPENTRYGSNEIFTSPNSPWKIAQGDYSVRVVKKSTGEKAEFYSQNLLERFLEAVIY